MSIKHIRIGKCKNIYHHYKWWLLSGWELGEVCSKQEKPTLKVKKSLGRKINFYAEDCSRYRGWGLVEILKLKHSWDFEVEVWSRFWNFGLVQVIKSRLGRDYEARFDRDFKVELVDVVIVADVEYEERVGNSLIEILTLKIVQDTEARFDRDFKVQSIISSWSLVKILMLMFRWDFEVDARSRF